MLVTQEDIMPYVNNDGVRIHYHLVGKGPPLVLQHGFTHDMDDWREAGSVDACPYALRLRDIRWLRPAFSRFRSVLGGRADINDVDSDFAF